MPNDALKYAAFISYSHADESWAKWLHRSLESYRVPSRLVGKIGSKGLVPKRIGRCFRDQAELSAASHLGETLRQALRDAQTLIIICSPRSATSHWVNEEIKYFKSLGRNSQIYALIVDGEPNSKDPSQECFPPALLLGDDGQSLQEPLAADARSSADGKTDGFLKLAAALLGVDFDELRQREQRRRTQVMGAIVACSLGITAVTTILSFTAYHARNEAQIRRQQADELINFMLGDLYDRLNQVGRLDVLDAAIAKVLGYLNQRDIDSLDDKALAQRIKALNAISSIRIARGQIPEGLNAAQLAVDAARELSRHMPTAPETMELLSEALSTTASAMEFGSGAQLVQSLPILQEAHELAERAAATDPNDLDFKSNSALVNAQLGHFYGNIPKPDLDQAISFYSACMNMLRPVALKLHPRSQDVSVFVACESGVATNLYRAERFDDAVLQFETLMEQSPTFINENPDDWNRLDSTIQAISNATTVFTNLGRFDLAESSSRQALVIGHKLIAHDPNNSIWNNQFANLLMADMAMKIKLEKWSEAQLDGDEGLKLSLKGFELDPSHRNLGILIEIREHRARLAVKSTKDYSKAFAEIDAALELVKGASAESDLETDEAYLRATEWYFSIDHDSVRANKARLATKQLLEKLAGHKLLTLRMTIAYLDGDALRGDQFYEQLLNNKESASAEIKEIRKWACDRIAKRKGPQCRKIENLKSSKTSSDGKLGRLGGLTPAAYAKQLANKVITINPRL